MKERVEFIQKSLQAAGFNITMIDGIMGSETRSAINAFLKDLRSPALNWSEDRKINAVLQHLLDAQPEIEVGTIDGYYGPQTEFAFEQALHYAKHGTYPEPWRSVEEEKDPSTGNPNGWPERDEASLRAFYGEPGDHSNFTQIELPFPMRLAWAPTTTVTKLTCHRKVAPSLLRILEDIAVYYSPDEIKDLGIDLFGGCFNYRKMRGGSSLSTHAWAIAVDLHPAKNRLRWKKPQAVFSHEDYDYMIQCFLSEGWTSLGRAKDYDWMHFQATI